jgi:hypothetical protein
MQKDQKPWIFFFFWLTDRVTQGHFIVEHIPGIWNIADHFTKALPQAKFYQFISFITVNIDNEEKLIQKKKTYNNYVS